MSKMDYKVEPVELEFGNGGCISIANKTYEQFVARDGLIVKIFKAPYEENGQIQNTDYHGIIHRATLEDNEQDYKVFRDLTDRLTNVSGEDIRNSKIDYMSYISYNGLDKKLERVGISLKYNLSDQERLPEKTRSIVKKKSHFAGAVSDVLAYAAGFALIGGLDFQNPMAAYAIYAAVTPMLEGLLGVIYKDTIGEGWCGPLHAPGFIASRHLYKRKILDTDYVIEQFMGYYYEHDARKDVVGQQKEFSKILEKADKYYTMIEDLFPFTTKQRGFSVHYKNPDREKVVELFSFLLTPGNDLQDGNAPELTLKTKDNEKKQQEIIYDKPVQTDFINPWIEIPEFGDNK